MLFERILKNDYAKLPDVIRDFHSNNGVTSYSGVYTIEGGHSILGRLLASLFGFPHGGIDVAIEVEKAPLWITSVGCGVYW